MLIRRRKGWEIAESQATPEHVFFKRRDVLKAAAILPALAALGVPHRSRTRSMILPALSTRQAQRKFRSRSRGDARADHGSLQ